MKKSDVLKLPSMPLQSPTYPVGPYKFFERQYMIVNYRSDPAMIRQMLGMDQIRTPKTEGRIARRVA